MTSAGLQQASGALRGGAQRRRRVQWAAAGVLQSSGLARTSGCPSPVHGTAAWAVSMADRLSYAPPTAGQRFSGRQVAGCGPDLIDHELSSCSCMQHCTPQVTHAKLPPHNCASSA